MFAAPVKAGEVGKPLVGLPAGTDPAGDPLGATPVGAGTVELPYTTLVVGYGAGLLLGITGAGVVSIGESGDDGMTGTGVVSTSGVVSTGLDGMTGTGVVSTGTTGVVAGLKKMSVGGFQRCNLQ